MAAQREAQERRRARDDRVFEEALLDLRLTQGELAQHQQQQRAKLDRGEAQRGGEAGEPAVPTLSREQALLDSRQQQERREALIGSGDAGSSAETGEREGLGSPVEAERALEGRFEPGGTQLAGEWGSEGAPMCSPPQMPRQNHSATERCLESLAVRCLLQATRMLCATPASGRLSWP